jgi:hypothetical protein
MHLQGRIRDNRGIVRLLADVKFWPPPVEVARPFHCPRCGVGAREDGVLWLYGHGLVDRQQRGPAAPGEDPVCVVIAARRYLCRKCATVIRVVPASCAPGKHFSGAAIALALSLWGALGMGAGAVRERVSDWARLGASARGWRSLRRWAAGVAAGALFSGLHLGTAAGPLREVARRAAQALAGHAPPASRGAPVEHQAMIGSGHVS